MLKIMYFIQTILNLIDIIIKLDDLYHEFFIILIDTLKFYDLF